MAKKTDENFYVEVAHPGEIQRSVLEATKFILNNLKRYESFRNIRKQKTEMIEQLTHIMGEINVLNNRLRRELPSTGLRAISDDNSQTDNIIEEQKVIPKKAVNTEKPKKQARKAAPPKKKSDLDLIEDELSEIEAKLKGLEH